jgi:hypothetical protein
LMVERPIGNLKPELVSDMPARSPDFLTGRMGRSNDHDDSIAPTAIELLIDGEGFNAVDGGG